MIRFYWYFISQIYYRLKFKKFGKLSYIGHPLFLYNTKKIKIGNKVRIFPNSRLEVHGENSLIEIKNNVSIGNNLMITSGSAVIIGVDCIISANVFINSIDINFNDENIELSKKNTITNPTIIGDNCFIGYGVSILTGTVLGNNCIVGANSVIKGIFPPNSMIAGNPGKIIKYLDLNIKKWVKC